MKLNFKQANDHQLEAIKHVNGPLLIIAGPGTGKTYTLINRALNLIVNEKVKPSKILFATFTEKAAAEMKERIIKELQKNDIEHHGQENWISTIHGFCSKLLRKHAIEANLSPDFELADEKKQQEIYQNIVQKIKNNEIENIEFIKDIAKDLDEDKFLEDIKELYETSMSITSDGTIFARELIEV